MSKQQVLAELQARQYIKGVDEYRALAIEWVTNQRPNWGHNNINERAALMALIYRAELLAKRIK